MKTLLAIVLTLLCAAPAFAGAGGDRVPQPQTETPAPGVICVPWLCGR
jgi:hypothetical protein